MSALCASLTRAGAPCRAPALRGGVSCVAHSAHGAPGRPGGPATRSRRHRRRAAEAVEQALALARQGWRRAADGLPAPTVHVILSLRSEGVCPGYLSYGGGTWTVFGLPYSIVVMETDMWQPMPPPPVVR